jgi:FkbM family methyltransferase
MRETGEQRLPRAGVRAVTTRAGEVKRVVRNLVRGLYRTVPFKQPVFELVRQLVRLPEPVYRHLHFEGVIDVPVEQGAFRMRHHGTQIENEVFWSGLYGRWEGGSLRVWVGAAREARAILDVGANAGLYTLAARAVAPAAAVAAVEPVARIRAKLADNVRLNAFDVTIVGAAASDRDGAGSILDPEDPHALSATLDPGGAVLAGRRARRVPVTLARIDTLVREGVLPAPDLVKIDVEGHEAAVLRGMGTLLRERRPVLLVEVLTPEAAADVDSLVRPLGYLVHRLDSTGPCRLERVEPAPGTNLALAVAEDWGRLRELAAPRGAYG